MGFKVPFTFLIIAYVFLGLASLFYINLTDLSPYSIIFFRMLMASIVEISIVLLLIILITNKFKTNHCGRKYPFFWLLWSTGKQFYTSRNRQLFQIRRIYYLILLGFNIVAFNLPLIYTSFSISGIIASVIIIDGISLLLNAIVNLIRKEEELDLLKIVYITLLAAAVITIAFNSSNNESQPLTTLGVIILCIIPFTSVLKSNLIAKDSRVNFILLNKENQTIHWDKNTNDLFIILQAFYKLAAFHIFGIILILPISFLFSIFAVGSYLGEVTHQFLYVELRNFSQIFLNPSIILMATVSTALPYLFIFLSSILWPKNALKHPLWSGILGLIDPMISMYIGWLLFHENIRVDYVLFTSLFIISAIILRYFHESSNTRQLIAVLSITHGNLKEVIKFLKSFAEVDQVDIISGDADLIVQMTVKSMRSFNRICNKMLDSPLIKKGSFSISNRVI